MVILNVDDDKDDREMFCEAFKEIYPSIDCIAAHSAREALKMLDSGKHLPNYIFLNINMPVMDGKTCLKKIKRIKNFPVFPSSCIQLPLINKRSTNTKAGVRSFLLKH